jgi:hypothetical protein
VRILLDECLPRRLKRDLNGHDVRTVPEMGWASKENGDLLQLAESQFEVFLTVDRNLSYQRASKVNHPTAAHTALKFPPPAARTTGLLHFKR